MIPIAKVIVSPTEPTGKNRKKVWMQKGKNLFNKNNVVIGMLNEDGSITYTSTYRTSDFIKINPNTNYYKTETNSARAKFYDKNRNPLTTDNYAEITDANAAKTFVTPENAEYLRLTLNVSYLDSLQIIQGTEKKPYEDYIEPKIYIKNSNDVYEEFKKKDEEIYSTSETKIGTWIDGKTLYRRVINLGAGPNSTTKSYDIGINCNNITKAFIYLKTTSQLIYLPFNSLSDSANNISYSFSSNYLNITANKDRSDFNVVAILEYTKTTN